jgi:hypothetical protein
MRQLSEDRGEDGLLLEGACVQRNGFFWIVLCMALTMFPTLAVGAGQPGAVIEEIDSKARIDWSKWVIYVTELEGVNDGGAHSPPVSNLFSAIQKIRIDGSTRVADLIQKGSMVRNQLHSMIQQAQIVKRGYLSNGAVELTLAFDLKGGFAQLALPPDIQPVPQIKTLRKPASEAAENGKRGTPRTYTGLILDARGLSARPAMSPKIVSEAGDEVYGPTYVSREFAVQKGMVQYTCSLESGKDSPRAGCMPLLVRALRTQGLNRSDFIVSNADANEIQGEHMNLQFLKECQVTIVIDPLGVEKAGHAGSDDS